MGQRARISLARNLVDVGRAPANQPAVKIASEMTSKRYRHAIKREGFHASAPVGGPSNEAELRGFPQMRRRQNFCS